MNEDYADKWYDIVSSWDIPPVEIDGKMVDMQELFNAVKVYSDNADSLEGRTDARKLFNGELDEAPKDKKAGYYVGFDEELKRLYEELK